VNVWTLREREIKHSYTSISDNNLQKQHEALATYQPIMTEPLMTEKAHKPKHRKRASWTLALKLEAALTLV